VTSRYVVFTAPEKVEVREETLGDPGPGEVLCRAEKSLISIGTETHCLRGVFDPGTNWAEWVQYPFRPGYSMVGKVVKVGPGVATLAEGDRVATSATHQEYFRLTAGGGTSTGQPFGVCVLPDDVSAEDGTWMPLACTTQLGVRRAALALGESVGVVGLGMLGQLVVQYLALSGARRVVAIDTVESRLGLARDHGATHVLACSARDARERVEEITGGRMLDVVFDVTGHPAVLAPATRLLRRLGRVVLLGDTTTPSQQHLGPRVLADSLSIHAIHALMRPDVATEWNPWTAEEMAALFFDYVRRGRMRVADLVTHRHRPEEAPAVYARLLRDRSSAIGVVFDWTTV
jgi:2-desacetyl-2-hydroxyethyl bacteriochlorophyllide A dehydrogenase